MQVKSLAECSKGSILQYISPALSNHLSFRSLFCLFLRGRLTQVLLYILGQTKIFSFSKEFAPGGRKVFPLRAVLYGLENTIFIFCGFN